MTGLRRGLSVLELLIVAALLVVVMTVALLFFRSTRVSMEATLLPQMGLQQAARRALVDLIRDVQESVDVVRPEPGSTLTYFIARDKLNQMLTVYLTSDAAASRAAGSPLYQLWLHRREPDAAPGTGRMVLGGVERATFTRLSSGVLQLRLDLREQGRTYSMLTAIRARNVLQEGDL